MESKLDEKLATYFDLIRKQLIADREQQIAGIQALIEGAKDEAEKEAMARVKRAMEIEAKDTRKIDNMCKDYTKAIKENVVKDTSKIIHKISKPKTCEKSSSSKGKIALPTSIKEKANDIVKKAADNVATITGDGK